MVSGDAVDDRCPVPLPFPNHQPLFTNHKLNGDFEGSQREFLSIILEY